MSFTNVVPSKSRYTFIMFSDMMFQITKKKKKRKKKKTRNDLSLGFNWMKAVTNRLDLYELMRKTV